MKWESINRQELKEPNSRHLYLVMMWRTPVPGGWLIMCVNERSNDPQPNVSFYPDPSHLWNPASDPDRDTLLRPSDG